MADMDSVFEVKVPDVGEGVAEVELIAWLVPVGTQVRRRDLVAEVMTDKATVEVPAPVDGTIDSVVGEPGDVLAVGSVLFTILNNQDVGKASEPASTPPTATAPTGVVARPHATGETRAAFEPEAGQKSSQPVRSRPGPPVAARPADPTAADRFGLRANGNDSATRATPAVRRRAKDLGIDLQSLSGTGPSGRITHDDIAAVVTASDHRTVEAQLDQPVLGLRRKIAEKMSASASSIPHITYVDEVDVTDLERVRADINAAGGSTRLTLLPFLVAALTRVVPDFPMMNAHMVDDGKGAVLRRFRDLHVGVAAQTEAGLVVPVLRNAQNLDLDDCGAAIAALAQQARDGTLSAEQLSGSTITISSLGALGGLVTTPIINKPETAIVGVNKIVTRPRWDATSHSFSPRQVMNLSCSFDHRVIDGWDAANFVQRIRSLLESPALLLV